MPAARIRWFANGNGGTVDSTGLVKGGFIGTTQVTAVAVVPGTKNALGSASVRIVPAPAARVEFVDAPTRVVAGTRLTLLTAVFSAQGDRRSDEVAYSSSNSRVASVTPDGRLNALAAGRAVITARAGTASATLPIDVLGNTVASVRLTPGQTTGPHGRRRGLLGRGHPGERDEPGRGGDALERGGRPGGGDDRPRRVVRGRDAGELHRDRRDRRPDGRRAGRR